VLVVAADAGRVALRDPELYTVLLRYIESTIGRAAGAFLLEVMGTVFC
jgi:hypothetical protein